MSNNPRTRAWVEVRAAALLDNARAVQASVGAGVRLMPMVKADAYGLGVEAAVKTLEQLDPWGFGVATVAEGTELRRLGVARPVVIVSPVPPAALPSAVEAGLQVSVSDTGALDALLAEADRRGARAAFHVEIDTGMGRAGFDWRTAREWAPAVRAAAGRADWIGCYTHLHSADEDAHSVHEQWTHLQEALAELRPPADTMVHVLNSAGALRLPEYAAAAVRPGIFLYGGRAGRELPEPDAVMSLHARVVRVSDRRAGDTVGYGATHRAPAAARWATLAIGYGDGFPRSLGNRGIALLRGRRAPIVGRISMDVTVVDITGIPGVEVGDVATLVGTDGGERITLDEVASQAGTISYEILTGLTSRLPRVWTEV